MNVLFVCTANACRSPFAEHLVRRMALPGVEAASAGTHAGEGAPATWSSIVAARAFGVDLAGHRSRPLRPQIVGDAARIYVFDQGHREHIARAFPAAAARVALLGELRGGPGGEIIDPVGGSQEDVDICYRLIDLACRALAVDLARP